MDHTLTIHHDGERYVMTVDDQPPWQTVFAWALLEKLHLTLSKWNREVHTGGSDVAGSNDAHEGLRGLSAR